MRVLFTCQPGSGHLHPLVALAQAIEAAGHEVAFASTSGFCPNIEGTGFRCFRAGIDDTQDELRQRQKQQATLSSKEQGYLMLEHVFAGTRAERSLPDVLDIIHRWQPDLVVRDNTEFAGCVAAERAGIPHATVQLTAARSRFMQKVAAPLNRLCVSVGLPPCEPADLLFRYLVLSPRPSSLWNPAVPVPPTSHAFRYAGFSQSGTEQLPGWVAELEVRPTVYATLGTVFNHMTPILSAIIEGLRQEPINLIVTVGRNRDPREFGEQPPNVHIERYIPQNLLLPYCDLVVTHGGSGTIMDALSVGLPLVILPVGADQPDNAQACVDVGVARVIQSDQRTAEAIRDATRDVLQDPRYRWNAERIRAEIDVLPGLEYSVTLLEKLAAECSPILSSSR